MLTLQNLLESDSLSTIISKLNNNFQTITNAGGGPQGIRGYPGLPGRPGRVGSSGPTGEQGPAGLSTYLIPFAEQYSAATGPSSIAGPWPSSSYAYLTVIGTGASGDIYVDHNNRGYWMYLRQADATGQYANIGASYPPTGTGFFGGTGWYFYPQPEEGTTGDVWVYDYTTYLNNPPYSTGPFYNNSSSPLEIPNARFSSKYGTIWVSAGNSGGEFNTDYTTPIIGSWGATSTTWPQPGRWNAGVDRLMFKLSADSLPYLSNVNARGIAALGEDANEESTSYPSSGLYTYQGDSYWVKPMYDVSLDKYTPLFFWSELRPNDGELNQKYSTLGLYQFTATDASPYGSAGGGVTAGSVAGSLFPYDTKSVFLLSTRSAPSPEDWSNMGAATLANTKTTNLADLIIDVKSLITTNQYLCAVPQDFAPSSDLISSGYYGSNVLKASQGYISTVSGKNVGGANTYADTLFYGGGGTAFSSGTGTFPDISRNEQRTRRTWYGSAFSGEKASDWSSGGSDPKSSSQSYYTLAGMSERGKKTWNAANDTWFLSELLFYTSQFKIDGGTAGVNHNVTIDDFDYANNAQNSRPVLYISPFRNVGIGTFANAEENGTVEPRAKLQVHLNPSLLTSETDPSDIYLSLTATNVSDSPTIISKTVSRVAMFTGEGDGTIGQENPGFIDVYLGRNQYPTGEFSNPASLNPYGGSTGLVTTPLYEQIKIAFRREGWLRNRMDSLRIGVSPVTGPAVIGSSATNYTNEFQLALHPLNKFASSLSNTGSAMAGFGVHNLWPRARFHAYGKNVYNETDRGYEIGNYTATRRDVVYPGPAGSAQGSNTASSAYPHWPTNYPSDNQVVIDYIKDSYLYSSGILDYPYTTYNSSSFVGTAGVGTAAQGIYSPNSANFPSREKLSPTRHTVPYGLTGPAGALYAAFYNEGRTGITGLSGMFNGSFRHGGIENALFKPTIYQGFNVYRDLMNVGDTKDTTYTWVIGTNGGKENGGSLILTNSEGDFAISTIKDGRGGGDSYRGWEQRLSTRDVLNNIKLIVKKDGSVGIGNAAGYDLDAYSSLERNPDTGFVNYVPRSADADGLTAGPYTAGSGTGYNREWGRTGSYGFVNYAGLSATWTETSATTYASQVNSNATRSETFKLEVAADKLHGRPGRTLENRGYGYPPNLSSQGIGTIQRYLVKNPSSGSSAVFASFAISTDQEGRITSASFTTDLSLSGYEDTFLSGVMFPHPTEFEDGGSQNMSTGFIAPAGAAAAAWDNGPITISGGNNLLGFQKDPLLLANLRLNNFVAGEGEGFTGIGYNAEMIAARTQSPKLVFTFLEGTGSAIPPNVPFGARPNGNVYTLPYRKVNTVLASAQNESSLREYWIPKADNSGGTLMVFTDHYGKKEKDTGFDRETIKVENLRLDEVVTLEFVTNLIGVNRTLAGTTAGAGNTALNAAGPTYTSLSYFPTNVLYKRLIMDESLSLGITSGNGGLTSALMNSDAFGIVNTQAPIPQGGNDSNSFILGNPFIGGGFQGTGTIGGYSSAIGFSGGFRACTTRNIEKYYNIQNDSTNWMDGWNDPNVENKMSEVRFKRINSDYVLFDFNLTFNVKNPKMSDQSNDQTSPEEPGYAIGGYGSVLPSNGTGAPQTLIDFGSPRWTQYITTPGTNI
jgi:hypothetical protein